MFTFKATGALYKIAGIFVKVANVVLGESYSSFIIIFNEVNNPVTT